MHQSTRRSMLLSRLDVVLLFCVMHAQLGTRPGSRERDSLYTSEVEQAAQVSL